MTQMTTKPSKPLLEPVVLGDLKLSNRVALAPMTRARAGASRRPNAIMADYYRQRANAGLVITEATAISEQALGWVNSPGIYTDEQGRDWQQTTKAVQAYGSTIVLQLWHCGRASHSTFRTDRSLPVAPSPIKLGGEYVHTPLGKQPYETPRELATAEVAEVVADYGRAAARAFEAGFDGVEIHAANGYLIDQFLQSRTNHRTDHYGASLENRYRFLDEIVTAVCHSWPSCRVGVRLSPNGNFNDMGSPDYRETFLDAAQRLDRRGLAYLHVMDGLAFGSHGEGPPLTLNDFRAVFRGPLVANCGYDFASAESAIESQAADVVAFGRPFISNPDLVDRYANNWPLSPPADVAVWYADIGARGYTDFPNYRS